MNKNKFFYKDLIYKLNYNDFYKIYNSKPKYIKNNMEYEYEAIDPNNCVVYFNENGFLSNYNLPAVIDKNFIMYCKDGYIHRTDGPAIIQTDTLNFEFYIKGKLKRKNGPVKILFSNNNLEFEYDKKSIKKENKNKLIKLRYQKYETGDIIYEIDYFNPTTNNIIKINKSGFFIKNRKNNNYPNYFYYSKNKVIMEYLKTFSKKYYNLHRLKYPAKIQINNDYNNSSVEMKYYNNGIINNINKPAIIEENNGNYLIVYKNNNHYHNENGPAIVIKNAFEWLYNDETKRIINNKGYYNLPNKIYYNKNRFGEVNIQLNNYNTKNKKLPRTILIDNMNNLKNLVFFTNEKLYKSKKLKILYDYDQDQIIYDTY